MEIDRDALEEWQRNQPLCILSLDPADRAVLRIAGRTDFIVARYISAVVNRMLCVYVMTDCKMSCTRSARYLQSDN